MKTKLVLGLLTLTGIVNAQWSTSGNAAVSGQFLGTTNGTDLVIKTNNNEQARITGGGNVGIGTNNPSQKLDIRGGLIHVVNSSALPYTFIGRDANPGVNDSYFYQRITNSYHLIGSNKNGSGVLRNLGFALGGSDFETDVKMTIEPSGDVNIKERLTIGNTAAVARLNLDGLNTSGLIVNSSNGNEALRVSNGAGAARFRVWVNSGGGDDTKTHIAGSAQIGFPMGIGMMDNTVRLNVDADNIHGVKLTTNNPGNKMFFVSYSNNTTFEVQGGGKTHIGLGRPLASGVAAGAMLSVDGLILAKDVRVAISSTTHWADYVFEKDYKLMPLSDVESFVIKNKHLPGVPSEAEVKKEGVDMTEMNIQLLQKLEELYLHTIELQKRLDIQSKQIESLIEKSK